LIPPKKGRSDYTGDEIIINVGSGESLYYYHPDHLGSASVITEWFCLAGDQLCDQCFLFPEH